jgi:hypothetical protein
LTAREDTRSEALEGESWAPIGSSEKRSGYLRVRQTPVIRGVLAITQSTKKNCRASYHHPETPSA